MSAGSAAVIAKARAKYGGLLGLYEYKTLISKANVGEIVAQLKTYGDFCEDFSAVDNTVRRSQSERLMEKRLFRIYDELRKFCPGRRKSVMPICTVLPRQTISTGRKSWMKFCTRNGKSSRSRTQTALLQSRGKHPICRC